MTEDFQGFLASLNAGYWHAFVVFIRVSVLVSVLPAFGERMVSVRIKLVVALAITAVVLPSVPPLAVAGGLADLGRYAMTETVVGLALGISIRLFVLALQTAGSIAAQSTSLAQILGGAATEPVPAMGYVLAIAGLALATMSGLHIQAAKFLIASYQWFPVGQFPDAQSLSSWGLERNSAAISMAFVLAAPFVIASAIYNLTLGVINRAMPQLMVAFVGAPVITFGGLFILFAAAPAMLSVWAEALEQFINNPGGALR